MDILLISPPHTILKGYRNNRGYSLGLAYLAAYLRANNIDVGMLKGDTLSDALGGEKTRTIVPDWLRINVKHLADGQKMLDDIVNDRGHDIWKKLADVVRRSRPIAVGIEYYTPLKYIVETVCSIVRAVDPRIKIIVGAFHPSFCPDEVLQNPNIDYIIRGEGEIPLLNLVREIKRGIPLPESIRGLSYRDQTGKVRNNPPGDQVQDLDKLPFPARDLAIDCDYDIYRYHSIATTRGCPYTCYFCSDRRLWGGTVRRRSVANVLEEIAVLKRDYNIDKVEITDGTFTYDKKWLEDFCRGMIAQNMNVKWGCTARFDNLTKEMLSLMKQAGCYGLYLGLESGSDRILKMVDKKETVEKDIEASKLVRQSGIIAATSILLGMPDETREDLEATLETMKHFKTDFFDVNSYMPLPGTPLYDSMTDEEKKSIDWHKVGMKSYGNHFTKQISAEELMAFRTRAYDIANSTARKTILRLGLKAATGWMSKR